MIEKLKERIGEGFNSFVGKKVLNLEEFTTENNVVLTEKEMRERYKTNNNDNQTTHSTIW